MVVLAVLMVMLSLAFVWLGAGSLLWLHRKRKVSDVTGTVVGRDRRLTGRGFSFTYPVVEFTTRDGTKVRRTFQQLTRPRIGRKLRIVYDPRTLDSRRRLSRAPLIYSFWLLLWFGIVTAFGLALLALCIALLAGAGSARL